VAHLAGSSKASPACMLPFPASSQLLRAGWLRTVFFAHSACADEGAEDMVCEGASFHSLERCPMGGRWRVSRTMRRTHSCSADGGAR